MVSSSTKSRPAIIIAGENYYIGEDLLLDLNEDGKDSGTFLATIRTGTITTGGASSNERSNGGIVKAIQGGTVTVTYSSDGLDEDSLTKNCRLAVLTQNFLTKENFTK